MGIDDDAEQPSSHGGAHHFPVGSRVEVLSDEEDLGGVYFSATVLRPPTSLRRSAGENLDRLYVEYHTLLASDDRPDRLREYVDISSVRPPPPSREVAKRFELNDVVDAYCKDGWWMGVVTGVLGGGERLVVTFEKPPDEREFRPSALRAHWDWVDGVWAGLQNLSEVVFYVGEKVEISFEREDDDDDDDSRGAWFPAEIVRDLENGVYLVEFKDKNGGLVKAEVDSANVRPRPPMLKDRKFGISERVDAFFDFGWWSGFIAKREVKKNEYTVFLEHMQLDKVFDRSALRAYMDWKDGKWFLASNSETASSSTKRRSGSRSGVLKKHKGQNERADQETEPIAVEKIVLQDEEMMRMVENVTVEEMIEDIETPSLVDDSSPVPQNLVSSVLIDDTVAPNELPASEWPFVKHSTAWKAIESMEVLRRLPQKPHFQPLRCFKETAREGLAIGCMVTFSNMVERSCSLNMNDPKHVIEDVNHTLLDLEKHGFDFGMVREHVMKLLEGKDKEDKLLHEIKDIKYKIFDHRHKKEKIEGEIKVMNDHIRRLQKQLELAQIAKDNKIQQIAHLQAGLDQAQQGIDGIRSNHILQWRCYEEVLLQEVVQMATVEIC